MAEAGTGNGTVPSPRRFDRKNAEAASREGYAIGLERALRGFFDQVRSVPRSDGRGRPRLLRRGPVDRLRQPSTFSTKQRPPGSASARHRLSNAVTGTVAARYGDIRGGIAPDAAASFGISSSDGQFWSARASVEILPTRTGVAVLVRGVRQTLETASAPHTNDSDKLAFSIAQDLSVVGLTPFGSDWKLLLALESARSTTATDREEPASTSRFLGGLALAF